MPAPWIAGSAVFLAPDNMPNARPIEREPFRGKPSMLTKCAECGSQVSTKAIACPSCGAPIPSAISTGKAIFRYVVYGLFAVILTGVLVSCYLTASTLQSAGRL